VDYDFVELEDDEGYYVGIEIVPPGERKTYQYKFGGNEFQDELGLSVYDFDNRVYDPPYGRFWQMDPLAEQGRRWSPYNYAFDNPVYWADPDGMWPKLPSWSDVKTTYNETKATVAKTYNQAKTTVAKTYNETKASVAKTYNETKKAVAETTNKAVAYTKETLKEGKQWVTDNKKEILNVANNMQDAGDAIAITGYGAAIVGAPIAGVGAAPGATIAAIGNGIGLLGSGIEIATNLIT